MSNVVFYVPKLQDKGVWLDWRGSFKGGYGWRNDIALSGIKKVVLHHSVTTPTKNATKDVQTLFNIHVNGNGWGGIGYNFVVTSEEKDGFAKVAYVGDLGSARAHAPNDKGAFGIRAGYGNNHLIGICFIGSFHTGALPTKAQLRSAHYLVEELIFKENARLTGIGDTWDNLRGHQEFDYTACPSNQLSKLRGLVRDTKEVVPTSKPYKTSNIPTKTLQLVREANVWDLNFSSWDKAKAIRKLPKGTVFDANAVADHDLGARYYLYGTGGINKADVKDYEPPKPPVTELPDTDEADKVPEHPDQDNSGTSENDLQGVKDSLSRIEAIVTQILEAIKKVFKL